MRNFGSIYQISVFHCFIKFNLFFICSEKFITQKINRIILIFVFKTTGIRSWWVGRVHSSNCSMACCWSHGMRSFRFSELRRRLFFSNLDWFFLEFDIVFGVILCFCWRSFLWQFFIKFVGIIWELSSFLGLSLSKFRLGERHSPSFRSVFVFCLSTTFCCVSNYIEVCYYWGLDQVTEKPPPSVNECVRLSRASKEGTTGLGSPWPNLWPTY